MKSIVVFNNKGGVGKTTLICNLSAYLAQKKNKRVLLIDADPQCNASIYLFGDETLSQLFSNKTAKQTIQAIIDPVSKGKSSIKKELIPIHNCEKFGIDVIVGDPKLSLSEDFLSKDWNDAITGNERGLNTTFVFLDLLYKLHNDYDYILFDVGPSLGALNRSVLLSSNYFLMPMSSDIFCLKAIENISESLSSWKKKLNTALDNYKDENKEEYCINDIAYRMNLSFLGYVNQQYTAKTFDGVKRPVKAYDTIISKMPEKIERLFSSLYPSSIDKSNLKLGDIPNFNSLVPLSQSANKPIFKLDSHDKIVGSHFAIVKSFEEVMQVITDNVLSNIEKYDLA